MGNFLNAKEAADFLGISEEKLSRLVAAKAIPAYMIADEFLRFKEDELKTLKEMLEENAYFEGDERIFHKEFKDLKGREKFWEVLRANDIYLIIGIAIAAILIFTIVKFWM
jgi:excisionase family DNA binding protein